MKKYEVSIFPQNDTGDSDTEKRSNKALARIKADAEMTPCSGGGWVPYEEAVKAEEDLYNLKKDADILADFILNSSRNPTSQAVAAACRIIESTKKKAEKDPQPEELVK